MLNFSLDRWGGGSTKLDGLFRVSEQSGIYGKQNSAVAIPDVPFGSLNASFTKEVVGIHVLVTHPLFGGDILRGFLQRVSPAKLTSAPVRF
jgi:hypothetical protein